MVAQRSSKVFLSHSHVDKRVARCLVRRLAAHGIEVWIDEREMQFGATLTSAVRTEIEAATILLVLASQASAVSKWVGLELDFAREHGKTIVPFFIDSLNQHERFRDYLGVDGTAPQRFALAVHDLMRDLSRSLDLELPPADPAVLETELRQLASEEPDLAPLILGCLDGKGLHQDNMDTTYKSAFHPLDEALNALFDLTPNETIASHAAYGFFLAGAGTRALFSWIAATGDGGLPLVTALGTERIETALIPTAIKLLEACNPPNNHALYNFISRTAAHLDPGQRRSVIRLVTWPVRADTSRLADVLGWVAMKNFPDAVEIQRMWDRWVRNGSFDGKPNTPDDLAGYLADAHKESLPGWEQVQKALRSHVREYLRSGDEDKVHTGVEHIRAAADRAAPVLTDLLTEAHGVSGTAEWNEWKKRDQETAERMGWYVFAFAEEAAGNRNWLRAVEESERMVAFQQLRRRNVSKSAQERHEET